MGKECFTVDDRAFSSRHCVAASKPMDYNYLNYCYSSSTYVYVLILI